jgi:hypothetical protein
MTIFSPLGSKPMALGMRLQARRLQSSGMATGAMSKKKVVILTKLEEIIRNVDTKPPVDLVFHLIIEELI